LLRSGAPPVLTLNLFSFGSDCDHRDLHSFPTRRSSDLPPGTTTRGACVPAALPENGSSAMLRARLMATPSQRWCLAQTPVIRRRSEEHTSELQSRGHLVCRLLLEKKKPRAIGARPLPHH